MVHSIRYTLSHGKYATQVLLKKWGFINIRRCGFTTYCHNTYDDEVEEDRDDDDDDDDDDNNNKYMSYI